MFVDANEIAAQLAVNLIDYRDNDSNVTVLDVNGVDYFGFERPCVYISEIAHRFKKSESSGGPIGSLTYRSYAVELHKPYGSDVYPEKGEWILHVDNSESALPGDVNVPVEWDGSKRYHVISLAGEPYDVKNIYNKVFVRNSVIELRRRVGGEWVVVDSRIVPKEDASGWLISNDGTALSIERDIALNKCIRRLWAEESDANTPTLGYSNKYSNGDTVYIQAHPANQAFTNV
ncbi:MAG: hypothetical protein ACYTBV_17110, partial [Planctomycetota bacterium]